ncbi:sucrase ferredoxin [Kibdelosporangium persicum]|uniref:Sucrase ferredoxin n=1 Tax=Kibdelosporangium persicum TaxID=2698649 RepID=A0ABX2FBE4_9PSEU|nr:sucrase ferredoxin [Kibdelosporangium persicum]NRN68538.1 Sucrase ferredoxin [Kibdelosporangium persicum]
MTAQLSDAAASAAKLPGCAVVARMLGGSPAGTAAHMRAWLLIEYPGPWPSDALELALAEAFPADKRERLAELRDEGLRPLLIRQPGRHTREPHLAGRRVFVGGTSGPHGPWMESFRINDLSDLADLDLDAILEGKGGIGKPYQGPMFLVCTHGTKDMCCALLGRPLASSLGATYPGRAWEVSHVGGDRWAGNLMVVPDGFLHGQLDPDEAHAVVRAALAGQVDPEHLRGRTAAETQWAQYAEIVIRKQAGLRGLDDVVAVAEKPVRTDLESEARAVTVRAGKQTYEVTISRRAVIGRGPSRCNAMVAPGGYITENVTLSS